MTTASQFCYYKVVIRPSFELQSVLPDWSSLDSSSRSLDTGAHAGRWRVSRSSWARRDQSLRPSQNPGLPWADLREWGATVEDLKNSRENTYLALFLHHQDEKIVLSLLVPATVRNWILQGTGARSAVRDSPTPHICICIFV